MRARRSAGRRRHTGRSRSRGRRWPSPFANIPDGPPPTGRPTIAKVTEIVDQFLVGNGALVRVNEAGREHGQIRAFNNRTVDLTKAVPTVVLRNEDYVRISRLLDDGSPVELEFNIVNHSYPEGKTSYNAVAEIPGTDRKGESRQRSHRQRRPARRS